MSVGVLSGGLLVGCASFDSETYKSRLDSPKMLEIVDQTTGEVLWGMQIPVAHTLKTDIDRDGDMGIFKAGEGPAQSFQFKLINDETGKVVEEGEIELKGYPIRRLSIGEMPEPGSVAPAAATPVQTAPTTSPATQAE